MDYKKIYDNLMNDRLEKKSERLILKKEGFYFEGHHIIPKYKGGSGNSSRPKNNPNIVLLTAKEHFLAHQLLWRIYRDRPSALALHKMVSCNKNQKRIISSKDYEEARLAFRETNMGNQYGKGVKKVVSEEQKRKQSQIMKGRNTGENNPAKRESVRKKISDKLKGRKKSDTHIEKLKISNQKKPKIECPFCGILTNRLNSNKWHFNKCKLNPNMEERPTTNFIKNNNYGCKKIINIENNEVFQSVKEASIFFNVHPLTITRWIKNNIKVKYFI